MYEAKRTKTAAGTARTEFPLRTAAFLPLLLLLLAVEAAALLVAVEDPTVAGLSVEEMTGEVGDRVAVAVPCSTSKYMP